LPTEFAEVLSGEGRYLRTELCLFSPRAARLQAKTKISTLEEEREHLGSTLRGLEASGDLLLRSAEAERETLQQQIAGLTAEGEDLRGAVTSLEAEREPLRLASEAMEAERAHLRGMSTLEGELEKLHAAASGLEAEPRLREALLALQSDRARLLGEVGRLQAEGGELRKTVEALRDENEGLREALSRLETELQRMRENELALPEKGGSQNGIGRVNASGGQMGEVVQCVMAELDQLSGELRGALVELGPQLESLGGAVKQLEGEREMLKGFGRKAKAEIVRLRNELLELQERAGSASSTRAQLATTKVGIVNSESAVNHDLDSKVCITDGPACTVPRKYLQHIVSCVH
jgi:predicted nuclease with TOPRIM domain